MINGFITLLLFQVLGEAIAFALSVPIPGSVIGMVFLFFWLLISDDQDSGLIEFSAVFLRHLSLLFIPAAVGIMVHVDRLASEWVAILIAVLGSTLISIIVTAYVTHALKHDD